MSGLEHRWWINHHGDIVTMNQRTYRFLVRFAYVIGVVTGGLGGASLAVVIGGR